MYKPVALLALGSLTCACATQQTAKGAATGAAQTERVCETVEDEATGTKIATRQECRTIPSAKAQQPSG